jgi:PD-(D/E)XK nuclease superfamily
MLNARAKKEDPYRVLAAYEKEYQNLFLEEREEYGDLIGDCRQIFDSYLLAYVNDGMKVVASEYEVRIPLVKNKIEFKGHIDRVLLEKKTKLRWLSDSKSHKNIPGEEARFHDLQTVFYLWAWNLLNPRRPIDGIMWDYLRTKLPMIPEVLKSGYISQRANIDTTHQVALRFVHEHCRKTGQSISYYGDWLDSLKGREERFLKRVFLASPPKVMIQTIVSEMILTAEQMLEYEDDNARTMTPDCSWCEFRDLCTAELRGQDAEFIRKAEYTVDEKLREEYAEEG